MTRDDNAGPQTNARDASESWYFPFAFAQPDSFDNILLLQSHKSPLRRYLSAHCIVYLNKFDITLFFPNALLTGRFVIDFNPLWPHSIIIVRAT